MKILSIFILTILLASSIFACVQDRSRFRVDHAPGNSPVAYSTESHSYAFVWGIASSYENGEWSDDITPNYGWRRSGWYEDIGFYSTEPKSEYEADAAGARAVLMGVHVFSGDSTEYYDTIQAGSWPTGIWQAILAWLFG